jgi:lipopolysaccharide export system protein LptA
MGCCHFLAAQPPSVPSRQQADSLSRVEQPDVQQDTLPLQPQIDSLAQAQGPALERDTVPLDSLLSAYANRTDSLQTDSVQTSTANFSGSITLSRDSLDAPVDYTAEDSMIYDIINQRVHLWGDASVTYTTINLKAGHIIFDWKTNIVTAEGIPDSIGLPSQLPEFTDGEQTFTADSMRYNFEKERGVVYDVVTQQNDVLVRSSKAKFVTQAARDSTEEEQNVIYNANSIFTTCTHDEPHFGIRSRKQKTIPNKVVVVGASNVEIMNVPTPLWLPFGFFPISQGRQTGLLFPRDYQYSPQWGFGLEGIGWYFPLSDNFNLSLTSNLYLKGTWGVNAISQYKKRYKYSGNFNLGYDVRRSEDDEGVISRPKSFLFQWSHRQESSAHPTINFGGSINIQSNDYQRRVFNDQRRLENQLRSNFNFSKNWRDKPFNFNASFNHNQNSNTRRVTVSFPNMQFQTQAINPFKLKERAGKEKWFEAITMRYRAEARNRFEAADTTLFTQETLQNAQFGIQQNLNGGTSFKVLKYFNLNPSFNYDEVWYLRTLRKDFDPTAIVLDTLEDGGKTVIDTVQYGEVTDRQVGGFEAYRQFNAGVSLNTQIFGTLLLGQGKLRGLRHVMKPSLSFNFAPDYTREELGYFRQVRDEQTANGFDEYSIFQGGIFGGPSQSGRQMSIGYSLNNIFEAKVFSKKDSTEKKIKLFDNFVVGGNYNFAADSLNWSRVSMRGTARFLKGITTLSLQANFDPYITDDKGRRVNQFAFDQEGKVLRFDGANARLVSNITVGKLRSLIFGEEEKVDLGEEADRRDRRNLRTEETDFLSLFENFRISHNIGFNWEPQPTKQDTFFISTNVINCSGSIQLTDNWFVNIGNFGYDFVRKGVTFPSVGFTRDLHCWTAGANWQPTIGTYSFFIRVKPGSLDFLNVPYNRTNADARARF